MDLSLQLVAPSADNWKGCADIGGGHARAVPDAGPLNAHVADILHGLDRRMIISELTLTLTLMLTLTLTHTSEP